jgi:hypothetical protein
LNDAQQLIVVHNVLIHFFLVELKNTLYLHSRLIFFHNIILTVFNEGFKLTYGKENSKPAGKATFRFGSTKCKCNAGFSGFSAAARCCNTANSSLTIGVKKKI